MFGDRFTLRPFIREAMQGQDVVTDFFHTVLQGAPFTLSPMAQTNEALSLDELAGMRVVQSVLIERDVPRFLRLSLGGAIASGLAAIPGRSRRRLQLDRASAAIVRAGFRKDAEALDAEFFPDGLMVQAVDAALSGTLDAAPSLEPDSYFSTAAQRDLRQLAGQVADLVDKEPHAWRDTYLRRIGQFGYGERQAWARPNAGGLGKLSATVLPKRRNAAAVWDTLDRLCLVLAAGRSDAG